MKKILLSLVVCLGLVSFASQTYAQSSSTALTPYAGAKHTYVFDGIKEGRAYEFYLSTNFSGFGTAITPADNLFKFSAATGNVTDNGKASVDITWGVDAATAYGANDPGTNGIYLFVHITGGTAADKDNVCDNYKAVKIVPVANAFNVLVADNTIDKPSCPDLTNEFQPIVTVANDVDQTNSGYVAGKSTISFKVSRAESSNPWNFVFDIASTGTGTFTYSVAGEASATLVVNDTDNDATDVSVDAAANDNFVIVTIIVNNIPGENPIFTLGLDSAQDATTLVTDLDASTTEGTHTINILPVIGNFKGF